ncbi:uncharacterized protein LOC143281899 isoform X2 [Babylonia areolata]|uniref:uncharacterized protein LOC143281899 isoform X1 n=1 Tax=Babylonia areolata TaxID=304850 RepID=UPI003FD4A437
MAGWGTRLALMLVVLCFLASVLEARGGRGGGFRGGARFRYRYRGGGSRYSSGRAGGGDAGTIVGIIFGSIAGVVLLVITIVCCRAFCCSDSSGSANYSRSRGVVLSTSQPTRLATTSTSATTTTPYDNSSYKPSCDSSFTAPPPSYDSAVTQKDGALPYSSQPNGDTPYPPTSHPAGPSPAYGFSLDGANGAPHNSDTGNAAPSAPSYI